MTDYGFLLLTVMHLQYYANYIAGYFKRSRAKISLIMPVQIEAVDNLAAHEFFLCGLSRAVQIATVHSNPQCIYM